MENTILNVLTIAEIAEFMEWQTTGLQKTSLRIEKEIHSYSVLTKEEFLEMDHGLEFLNVNVDRYIVRRK